MIKVEAETIEGNQAKTKSELDLFIIHTLQFHDGVQALSDHITIAKLLEGTPDLDNVRGYDVWGNCAPYRRVKTYEGVRKYLSKLWFDLNEQSCLIANLQGEFNPMQIILCNIEYLEGRVNDLTREAA